MPDDDRQNSFYTDCFAGDNLEACKDGFNSSVSQIQDSVSLSLNSSIDAILKGREILYKVDRCYRSPVTYDGRTPSWISSEDEELIQNANIKPDIVVEQDGSGNYRTISEAIKAAPSYRKQRFYIYVKQGIYSEYVNIGMDKWNLVMFGDGMYKTIVTGSKSKNGGYDINNSGTFIVQGKRFIARDMGFVNTAGNSGEQAVALYATTDRSVFYRCQINGYQDTLYVNAGLQFYRECDIYGTIDFIFGNAAAVIQSSTILAKRPQQGRGNAIVAQGRTDSRCQTAIVIQSSTIKAAEDLSGVTTALGRPWKTCSAVVYLNNYMESLISPIGWTPMNPGTPPDTIFLAEYGNKGPGSNVAGRVNWKGVRTNLSYNEANRYTVNSLISGSKWLAKTRVPYNPGL
ncbi:putative pectinesterase/pectinesterase inhibitor 24 [Phtheirospermum japonicum]|uniref:Pectinesterase n=1 Tax=Phtheirospermum japonicum TaxID=374723 RepID=A0A830DCR6_9LAMI|nr:putative pectinesterase/pectinesterase inhibitor 24 [Phtheirospermum japonicum]